jgi:hypothetical protein
MEKSKFKNKTAAIILAVILIALIVPIRTQASVWSFLGIDAAAKGLLITIGGATNYVLEWLLKASAAFFEGTLGIGFKTALDTIQIGWKVCRDFTNMLFILFMIVIAFGTILRTERYGVKKLLPKVIGVALLINFSLVLCSVIIDFSNITADFFIKDIKGKIVGKNGDLKRGAITATFADALNMTTNSFVTFTDCNAYEKFMQKECEKYSDVPLTITGGFNFTRQDCLRAASEKKADCDKNGKITVPGDPSVLDMFLGYTASSLILLIAAFTLFAGGIMILFRIIAIWFLVTISPLAFACYALPGLQDNWKKWWRTFLNWCIFAPAYAFFVWMAIQIAVSGANKRMADYAGQFTISGQYGAATSSPLIANPGEQLIGYLIIIGFLIGGLIVAKNLGIYGADTVMSIAQKAKKGATDWAKRTTMRPVKSVGTMAGAGALTAGGKLFGDTKLGRRMGAKAAQMKQSAAQTKENKAYTNLLKTMNDNDVLREVETASGHRKLIATQEAKRRGLLREAERPAAKRAMETMRAYGDEEGARSLEELRPDAIKDTATRQKAVERAIKDGTHKKWSKEVFESPEGAAIMEELRTQLGAGELTNVFKGWAKEIKDTAEKALQENFTNNFADKSNLDRRNAHAAATGKLNQAFFGDRTGNIIYTSDPNAQKAARTHVQKMKTDDFDKLKTNEDKTLVTIYMLPNQVFGAGTKLSGQDKKLMRRMAKQNNPQAYQRMLTADTWQ